MDPNWATCPYCASEGVIGQSADNRSVLRNDWLTRIQGRAPAHNAAAKAFFKLHYQLTILPAILTAFVGSSLFYGVQDPTLKLALGVLSFIATALTIVQANVRPAERAEKHRATVAQLGALRREIQQVDVSNTLAMNMVNDHYNKVDQEQPVVPDRIWRRLRNHAVEQAPLRIL